MKVCLRYILVLLKPKDFFTISNISGLKVAEQVNYRTELPIRLYI